MAHKNTFQKYPEANITLFWCTQNKRTFVPAAEESSQVRRRKANKSRITFPVGCAKYGQKEAPIVQ